MTTILGISSFYHDSAAALIKNDEIIAAAQEERFTRIKHDSEFPVNAIKYVLYEANIDLGFKPDSRDYGIGAQILRALNITKIKLRKLNQASEYKA